MAGPDSFVQTIPDQTGGKKVDAEAVNTDAGAIHRQRVAITGDLMVRLVDLMEELVLQQKLTNLLLTEEFRSSITIRDAKDI